MISSEKAPSSISRGVGITDEHVEAMRLPNEEQLVTVERPLQVGFLAELQVQLSEKRWREGDKTRSAFGLREDYPSLDGEKIELAAIYAKANPPRGRPSPSRVKLLLGAKLNTRRSFCREKAL